MLFPRNGVHLYVRFGLAKFADRWPRVFFDFHLHKQALPSNIIEVEAISGACMMVKRDALQDVGGWDEGYFCIVNISIDACVSGSVAGRFCLYLPQKLPMRWVFAAGADQYLSSGTSTEA